MPQSFFNESETPLRVQVAKKDHWCTICHRKIPKGSRYWRKFTSDEDRKEHTNCEEFRGQPVQQGYEALNDVTQEGGA